MKEPRRLFDGGGSDIEQMLVAAGRSAKPSTASRWKTGIMLGLASMGIAPKVAAAVVSRLSATTGFLSNGWVASAGIGLAAVGGAAIYATQVSPPASHEMAVAGASANDALAMAAPAMRGVQVPTPQASPMVGGRVDSRSGAAVAPTAPITIDNLPLATAPVSGNARAVTVTKDRGAARSSDGHRSSTARTTTTHSSSTSSSADDTAAVVSAPSSVPVANVAAPESPVPTRSLSDELRELDGARTAIANGDKRGAFSKLDHYAATFPNGTLRQEAFVLRIEALHAAGDDTSARALVDRFVAMYPDSAHSRRLRSLVQKP